MEKHQSRLQRIYQATGALLTWLAVIGQFYLIIRYRTASTGETIIRFFSYFTILTNILVALCFTACWRNKATGFFAFFSRPSTLAATTVYIIAVGSVYNILLRSLGLDTNIGLQWYINELLHVLVPILFVVFWLLFAPKTGLTIKGVLPWLIYPLFYCLFVIVRGAISGFYPYPFINVSNLGYPRALLNAAGLTGAFLLLSLALAAIGMQMDKRTIRL